MFNDMQQSNNNSGDSNTGELKEDDSSTNLPLELREDFDYRDYRPLEVDVSVIMHDVQAHLLKVMRWKIQRLFLYFYFYSVVQKKIHHAPSF